MKKRLLSIVTAFIMICSFIGVMPIVNIQVNAESQAEAIARIAKSQVGIKERSAGSDSIMYNDWYYGKVVSNASSGQYAWCAVFVSWCANQAGIPTSIIPKENNCDYMKKTLVEKLGGKEHKWSSGYRPVCGDIIFFGTDSDLYHVGIVTYTDGNTVHYIDGNNIQTSPHGVHDSTRTFSRTDVWGTVTPNYNRSPAILPGTVNTGYATPCWITANHKFNTFDQYGNVETNRWVDAGDNCYIEAVYTNGFVKIQYPASGTMRWSYAKLDDVPVPVKNPVNVADLGNDFVASITMKSSGKYVTASGGNVVLCGGTDKNFAKNHYWHFMKNANGYYSIYSYSNGKALDLNNATNNNGDNIGTYTPNGSSAQDWQIISGNGGYLLTPRCSNDGKVMDVTGASTADNTNIQLHERNNSSAQIFKINKVNDTTKPVISKVWFSHISKDMFRVEIDVTDNLGLKEVQVPVWSNENGQDDLVWHNATQYTHGHWYCDIYVKDHKNNYGKYSVDIYARDFFKNADEWRGQNSKRQTASIGIFKLVCDANGGKLYDGTTTYSPKATDPQFMYHYPNYCSITWLNPTKPGYNFTGWYTAKTGGTKIYGTNGKCVNEGVYFKNDHYQRWDNLTVYAQWKACSHKWGNWTTKNATCAANGSKTRKCSVCNLTETQTIAKLGHSMGNWTTKNATCTADGSKTRSCTRNGCTYKENQTIAKLGHSMGEWTTKNATCTADGSKTRSCIRNGCTHKETQVIAKTGHKYTSKVIAPTCIAKGYTEYICSVCNHTYKDSEKAAVGHSYTSRTENDVTVYECTACEFSYKVTFEGEGTAESPYLIENKEDLFCLANLVNNIETTYMFRDKCYMQTANIDLENEQWIPLGPYEINGTTGICYMEKGFVYDGGNHGIYNMNINEPFVCAGFIGKLNFGTVKNLAVYGNVNSSGSYVGGIVGELGYMGTIENCSFNGNIQGDNYVGGIVGHIWRGGNVINCYHNGTITAENVSGGIAGAIQYKDYNTELHSNINNCYHIGDMSGGATGGIVGKYIQSGKLNEKNTANIKNCYYHKTAAENGLGDGTITKNDSMPLISGMLKDTAPDLGSSFCTNEYGAINNGYPVFKWQLPSKVKGDINNDGEIQIADAVKAQKALSKAHVVTPAETLSSDMNDDGKFNVFDIIIIKRMLIK